ncbi:MAG: hypothetical protein KGJ23_00015 [Euryarchaeota archaeon]|nr:hypothetical protein [Euryarchaeota archaeon]MDE2046570.1 hypothetical protein [Thermoplasmata archaeon]
MRSEGASSVMRTYVRMIFNSEGANPQDVVKIMRQMGFEESMGMHDFVYKWKNRATLDEVLTLVSDMHGRMKGLQVNYEVTTIS